MKTCLILETYKKVICGLPEIQIYLLLLYSKDREKDSINLIMGMVPRGGSVRPLTDPGSTRPALGYRPLSPHPAQVALPLPIQVGEPAQIVSDDVVVVAARAGHDDHALVIGQFGDLLGGPGPTDLETERSGEVKRLALPIPRISSILRICSS